MNNEENVSISTTLKSQGGFEYELTMKGSSYTTLLQNIGNFEMQFKKYGLTSVSRNTNKGSFIKKNPEYVPDRACKKCGAKLLYATKRDGVKFIKCEMNKWDAVNKRADGCNYIEWPKDTSQDKS